jgi:hypothetical protein
MVQTGPKIKLPLDLWFGFQMAIKKPDHFVQFSHAQNKMLDKNSGVL